MRRDGGVGGRRRFGHRLVGGEQPDRPPRPVRRRGSRAGRAGPRRAAHARCLAEALERGRLGRLGDRDRRRGGHLRPRPHRVAAGRRGRSQGTVAGLGRSPGRASTTSRPTSSPHCWSSRTSDGRWWCSWSRAATPCWSRCRVPAGTDCWAGPSTTPPARPSTRWPGSSASATRVDRPSTGSPTRGTLRPSPFRGRTPGDGYDFSFSGLKTSVVNTVRKHPDADTADVAASFRQAVVDVLVRRAMAGRVRCRRQGAVPGRWGGRQLPAPVDRASRRVPRPASGRSCPAGPCAPTTPPWWRRRGGGGCSTAAPALSRWERIPTSGWFRPPDPAP